MSSCARVERAALRLAARGASGERSETECGLKRERRIQTQKTRAQFRSDWKADALGFR